MNTTFLFAEQKNIIGVLETLKNESLEPGTRICIDAKLVKELTETADKICVCMGIEEIIWKSNFNTMGFLDLRESSNGWTRVCRINSGKTIFTEKPGVPITRIIYIS